MTEQPDTLAAALAAFQNKLPRILKAETAQVRSDKGNYSYTYADLADVSAQIMPTLGEVGLSFMCRPTYTSDGRFVLAYSLLHSSGERADGEYPLPTGGTPQQLGSAITYGRRYCLCAVTGVAPEDDDDDGAAARQQPNADEQPQKQDANRKALQAEQRKVMQAGAKVGLASEKELADDYAARYDGADIYRASIEELSVYLGVLSGIAEQEAEGQAATDEAPGET